MHNGTDMEPIENNTTVESLRKKYNIQNNEKVFLFVGRLNILKNLPFLIRSLKILQEKKFNYKMFFFFLFQDGDLLKKQVKALNLEKNIVFVGKISDRKLLANYYALADLFLFPSLYDCSSLVQIEAASQKTPTLFLEGSATSDTVTPELNGYLSKNSELDYSNKIIEIFNNNDKYKKVCENAFNDLYLPWPKVVKKAYERYLYLIEKNK